MQEDAWERKDRSRLEEEEEEQTKRKVEEFKRKKYAQLYTSIPLPSEQTEQTAKVNSTHEDVSADPAQLTTFINRQK